MNNTNSISFKAGRIVARLFIPVLWPVRFLIVKPIKKLHAWIIFKRYPRRLRKVKKTAIERSIRTGKKQFGIKIGAYVKVWDRFEVMEQSKYFGKKLGKPFDYRKFTMFTCENGKITEV